MNEIEKVKDLLMNRETFLLGLELSRRVACTLETPLVSLRFNDTCITSSARIDFGKALMFYMAGWSGGTFTIPREYVVNASPNNFRVDGRVNDFFIRKEMQKDQKIKTLLLSEGTFPLGVELTRGAPGLIVMMNIQLVAYDISQTLMNALLQFDVDHINLSRHQRSITGGIIRLPRNRIVCSLPAVITTDARISDIFIPNLM